MEKTEAASHQAGAAPQPIEIICAADQIFELPTIVLIHSVLRSNPGEALNFHVLDGGLSPSARETLRRLVRARGASVSFLSPGHDRLAGLRLTRQFPLATWYRLLIPDLLPERMERVLYLDTDILVNTPIGELWRTELGDDYAAARLSTLGTVANSRISESEELRGRSHEPYFNAGVLLMNLAALRRDGVMERALDFGRRYPHLTVWEDQDALNAVCVGRWRPLAARWNLLVRDGEGAPFVLEPQSVLHFLGPRKPWLRAGYRGTEDNDTGRAHRIYAACLSELRQLLAAGTPRT